MILIESLQQADWLAAMKLAVANVPAVEQPAQVAHGMNLLTAGVLDPRAIQVARSETGELVGVQVCVPLQGASCLFWPPTAQDVIADALVQAGLDACRTRGTRIAQAFMRPDELPWAQPLLRCGFQHITHMYQLRHLLMELPPLLPSSLRLETFRSAKYRDFADLLKQTYQDTLDCPELNGKRSIDEIIAGHQAEGKYDPDRWWLAYQQDQPVGVVMLMELKDGLTWDLSYLGIVPAYRRRGHGSTLLAHALHRVRKELATSLVIAVDGRNTPALRLYKEAGFVEIEKYEVLLYFLG